VSQRNVTEDSEVDRLRAQVASLESQVAEVEAWANRAVAEAQVRTYWLDRWNVDLNEIMRRPSADRARAAARRLRAVYRKALSMQRRYRL
jgi:hypothetical protein